MNLFAYIIIAPASFRFIYLFCWWTPRSFDTFHYAMEARDGEGEEDAVWLWWGGGRQLRCNNF